MHEHEARPGAAEPIDGLPDGLTVGSFKISGLARHTAKSARDHGALGGIPLLPVSKGLTIGPKALAKHMP